MEATVPANAPRIAALFLAEFDMRKGYSVTWQRSIPDVDVAGTVEFKALPSGLHDVREDVIYFVDDDGLAGLSAFVNAPDDSDHRNARMLAVGVLVRPGPDCSDRLGGVWLHQSALRRLASHIANQADDRQPLDHYWSAHRISDSPDEPPATIPPSPSLVSASALEETCHPARALPDLLDTFGPLVFPLIRQAALRQRILLVGDAPVYDACRYVYLLSLLSEIPDNQLAALPPSPQHAHRSNPLFSIGVHDLPRLTDLARQGSRGSARSPDCQWIATTTDKILASKQDLCDVIVELPPRYARDAPGRRVYPTMRTVRRVASTAAGTGVAPLARTEEVPLKATQRDVRRFMRLRNGLRRAAGPASRGSSRRRGSSTPADAASETAAGYASGNASSDADMADLVEPLSWSALAYSSLVWLTSVDPYPDALDEVDDSYDEDEEDERMLQAALETAGSAESEMAVRQEGSRSARWGAPGDDSVGGDDVAAVPVALIPALAAYFAALTRHIFATMREAIDRSDRDADADTAGRAGRPSRHSSGSDARLATAEHYSDAETEAEDAPLLQRRPAGGDNPVEVTYSDITRMGLDPLSESVRLFVQAFVRRWWDREARIEANGITCCGLRVL